MVMTFTSPKLQQHPTKRLELWLSIQRHNSSQLLLCTLLTPPPLLPIRTFIRLESLHSTRNPSHQNPHPIQLRLELAVLGHQIRLYINLRVPERLQQLLQLLVLRELLFLRLPPRIQRDEPSLELLVPARSPTLDLEEAWWTRLSHTPLLLSERLQPAFVRFDVFGPLCWQIRYSPVVPSASDKLRRKS